MLTDIQAQIRMVMAGVRDVRTAQGGEEAAAPAAAARGGVSAERFDRVSETVSKMESELNDRKAQLASLASAVQMQLASAEADMAQPSGAARP